MAQVVITITDVTSGPMDGNVDVQFSFEPALDLSGTPEEATERMPLAHRMGIIVKAELDERYGCISENLT